MFDFSFDLGAPKPKTKRNLTAAQKAWAWDNGPKSCVICHKRVTKITDAEWDHVRAYAKGGATNLHNMKIAHRACNRIKGKKTLGETRKLLGITSRKKATKKAKSAPKRRRRSSSGDIFGLGDFSFRL